MRSIIEEYEKRESKEAIIVKDADNLELLLFLKEQLDIGNTHAQFWIDAAVQRLKTDQGKELGDEILKTSSHERRGGDVKDQWRVSRDKGN